jgi:3-oxoacyl-[acyl-carrier protein] reductase
MKKYIVTGAGQGIGHQIAQQLMAEGHVVLVNDIDATLLKGSYVKAGDVSSPAFILELVAYAETLPGDLAGCVCNAGVTTFGSFWEYSPDSMKSLLDLNIQGTFFLIQAVAKSLWKGGFYCCDFFSNGTPSTPGFSGIWHDESCFESISAEFSD